MKKSICDYLNDFEECGKIIDKASLDGDYKANNKAFKKTEKIYAIAKNSDEAENFYLTALKESSSVSTIIACCAHMMRLNIQPKLARRKLEKVRKNRNYPAILTFDAEMFLEEWDKGNIQK